jgi:hypothetical protein
MTAMQTGVPADVLNFDLLPDSAFVPIDTVAALLSVSVATIRRRIADGQIPAPQGVLGLQRYQVCTIRNQILKPSDFLALDDAAGGFDKPLCDANYREPR